MAVSAEIVTFRNRDGKLLFGTLHPPVRQNPKRPMIVLLSPGVKMRVGPHRLYNRMTEAFLKQGYAVFKFDFYGLGDSEGELGKELLAEVYNDTENGAFVNDGIDALDWLQNERGIDTFILGGLCGGAISSILLAQNDPRVVGLLSLGMTVTLAMGAAERTRFASQGELAGLRKGYFRRLLNPVSWLRLLTFQSDFRTIGKSLAQLIPKKKPKQLAAVDTATDPAKQSESNANPLFPEAFFKMATSGRKMLLIFSGADRLYWDFDEKFAQPYANELKNVADAYELHVVENANHVFSFREWEADMLQVSADWLDRHFQQATTHEAA